MARHVVSLHYTLRDPQGRLLDSSVGGDALSYLEGAGQIIEGLEEQLCGVAAGTKQQVLVPAAKAYGVHDQTQVQQVPRSALPVEELQLGDRFQTGPDRQAPVVMVVAIEGDQVTLDANHPLAGVDLAFDVEIVDVRDATDEEIAHGHAHCGDGCEGGQCGHGQCDGDGHCGGDGQCGS